MAIIERINKSAVVNGIAILVIVVGHTIAPATIREQVLGIGYFGFSGAITNWLAIHMLFEKVPGLYGSGIIPLKFEAFKQAIGDLIMSQFFTIENIEKFTEQNALEAFDLEPLIESLNYDRIYDGFVEMILSSKFGGMLGLFGGNSALENMRPNFETTLKAKLKEITQSDEFMRGLATHQKPHHHEHWQAKIAVMVEGRLAELTPDMVKEIIQNMIRSHLGWLVIWGGVFGGLIGLISSFLK